MTSTIITTIKEDDQTYEIDYADVVSSKADTEDCSLYIKQEIDIKEEKLEVSDFKNYRTVEGGITIAKNKIKQNDSEYVKAVDKSNLGNETGELSCDGDTFTKHNTEERESNGDCQLVEKQEVDVKKEYLELHEELNIKEEVDHKEICKFKVNENETELNIKYISSDLNYKTAQTNEAENFSKCSLCHHKFSKKSHLIDHVRIYTGEKPFKCTICNYKCSQKSSLVKHLRIHTGEKPFQCSLCEYKCSENSSLVKHARTHAGEKPFKHPFCNTKKFTLVRQDDIDERSFKCCHCSYKSSRKSNLIEHVRIHTGEKPFNCSLCDYKCTRKYHLVQHASTHTGEKPFNCAFCEYKCAKKGDLVQHTRTHTGEKPFKCLLCDFKCSYNSNLVKHARTHTGEKRKTPSSVLYSKEYKGKIGNKECV